MVVLQLQSIVMTSIAVIVSSAILMMIYLRIIFVSDPNQVVDVHEIKYVVNISYHFMVMAALGTPSITLQLLTYSYRGSLFNTTNIITYVTFGDCRHAITP